MKKFIFVLFATLASICSAHAQFVDGTNGLLTAPSAEFDADATIIASTNFLNKHYTSKKWDYNTLGYAVSASLFGRLEIAYSCTVFNSKWAPDYVAPDPNNDEEFDVVNQDRHFAARVALTKEGEWGIDWLPAIAIGTSDPVTGTGGDYAHGNIDGEGNGYFNRYYLVAMKSFETPWGPAAGHLGYQHSMRTDGMPKGLIAAVSWYPVWLNRADSFVTSSRVIAEYDARYVNLGMTAAVWDDHIELMAMLLGMQYPMFGARFKFSLSH